MVRGPAAIGATGENGNELREIGGTLYRHTWALFQQEVPLLQQPLQAIPLVPNGRVAVLTRGCHPRLYLVDIKPSFPGSTVVKSPPAKGQDSRDTGLIPGSGRSPGEGNGYPLWYSCLGNPMDREAWQATVHGFTKSWT